LKYYASKITDTTDNLVKPIPNHTDPTPDIDFDANHNEGEFDTEELLRAPIPNRVRRDKKPKEAVVEDVDDFGLNDNEITEEEERILMQKYMTDPRKNQDLAEELRSLRLDRSKFQAPTTEGFIPPKPDKNMQLGFDKRYYPFVPVARPNHKLINTFIFGNALYGHWTRDYVNEIVNLNLLINKQGGLYNDFNLVDLIKCENTRISNSASAIANHEMFFESLGYATYHFPQGNIADKFTEQYGSFSKFKRLFSLQALALNEKKKEGWCFLAVDKNFVFHIITTEGEINPHRYDLTPLMALDLHEHAYENYGDDVKKYINYWWFTQDWNYLSNLIVRHI